MKFRAENPSDVEIFYDGQCPLCRREIAFLQRLDRGRQKILFSDITAPAFDPAHLGRDRETLMARIHGRLPDGSIVEGPEVFRRAYAAVGLGWLLAPTRWPVFRGLAEAAYRWFAQHRSRLTGRAGRCDDCGPSAATEG